ncbi:hypothetical protein GCM10011365_04230 [Marinicella pacifica]|uniref:Cadherin domain-containing protein n=1 Tax=Marinicella pacifica TaxID=1171543 RepID=A0A917CG30_9GAMM|nr:Ig-like domain-containing protein [Marinicella pacifica]GGF86390.1 hypothetical protein GCM10011365_04230 [Marinicella pacifica]
MIRGLKIFILLVIVLAAFNSQAQNRFYHVYVDTDNNPGTGCNVNLPAFSTAINGADGRLTITTDSSQPPNITNTLYHNCAGTTFDTGTSINPAALGLNTGLNNEDVFEVGINRSTMNASASRAVVIYYATESDIASDIVLTNVDGNPIILGMALPVPAIGLVAVFILLIGFLMISRHHINSKLSVVIVLVACSSLAWAVQIVVDGQTADWSGVTPANTDPINDTSAPGSYADLTNVFFTSHNDDVYFRMDVVDVENQAPVANNLSDTTLEDNPITLTVTGSDGDSDPLTFSVNSPPANGSLSAFTVVNSTTSTVVYTPNADFNGNDSFTFVANDGQVNSAPASANVTITAVNDAPTFTSGGNVTHLETGGPYSQIWATNISPGAPNETGQTLSFTILSNDNSALFSTQPTIDASGTLNFEAATDASGTANLTLNLSDDGGTANGGADTSATVGLTITITDVNDPPSFTAGPDQTNNEDAGATTVNGWATGISAGPPDEAGQTLTFNITANDNPSLFSAGPSVAANGDLSYTPAPDANGVANITLELMDDGGTANGGNDTSPPQSFIITVTAVNDPPVFTLGADQNILEDSGAQTVNGWATGIAPGPADEASQTVSFTVTNNNNALFVVQPALDAAGNLSYTPAPDANGSAVVTVTASDDGGTANGGQDTSAPQNFTINIADVNDAPSFTYGGNPPASNEDGGPQSLAWASAISAGPANESGQTLSFMLTQTSIDATLSFAVPPSVNSTTGQVEYTADANAFGSASYDVMLMDDGGTANGGVDTSSPPVTLTITVNPVNDAPTVTPPGPFSVTPNIRIAIADGANDLLAGASDVEGTALNIQGSGTIITVNNGTVTVNTGNGAFSYDPPPGFTGTDSFQYQVCDNGIPLPAACSTPATVNLNVTGNVVWFIDNSASAGGNGTLMSPFDSLAAFNGSATPADGDYIYLAAGIYNEAGITLANNQVLFGQGTTGTFDSVAGITPPAYSVARPSLGGPNPLITSSADGVSLALNNTIRGVDIGNTTGYGISGGTAGNLNISETSISGNGGAINISTSAAFANNVQLDELSSNSNSSSALSLNGVSGTLAISAATAGITNGSALPAIEIIGGTLTMSYPGNINNTAGRSVNITSNSGGTVSFTGALVDSGTGINLANNGGQTVNFSNIDLDTAGNAAFTASNGGTLNVTGTNTIDTTTGVAVDLQNVSIGASGMTFNQVNVNGATSGIVLDTITGAGQFRITGTGTTAGSGGTIQNNSTSGFTAMNTSNIDLRNMNFTNSANESPGCLADVSGVTGVCHAAIELVNSSNINLVNTVIDGNGDASDELGIFGQNVTHFDMDGVTVQNVSDDLNEHGIYVVNLSGSGAQQSRWQNLTVNNTVGDTAVLVVQNTGTGSLVIDGNSTLSNAREGGFEARTTTAAANLTVTLGDASAVGVGDTLLIENTNTGALFVANNGTITANVRNSLLQPGAGVASISRPGSGTNGLMFVGISAQSVGTTALATLNATGNDNTQDDGGSNGTGKSNNALSGSRNISGLINDNIIVSNDEYVRGFFSNFTGVGNLAANTITIDNNTINMTGSGGNETIVGVEYRASNSNGELSVTTTNNTIFSAGDNGFSGGIFALAGNTGTGHNNVLCTDIIGNDASAPNAIGVDGEDYGFVSFTGTVFQLENPTVGALTEAQIDNHIISNDSGASLATDVNVFNVGGAFTGVTSSCPQ